MIWDIKLFPVYRTLFFYTKEGKLSPSNYFLHGCQSLDLSVLKNIMLTTGIKLKIVFFRPCASEQQTHSKCNLQFFSLPTVVRILYKNTDAWQYILPTKLKISYLTLRRWCSANHERFSTITCYEIASQLAFGLLRISNSGHSGRPDRFDVKTWKIRSGQVRVNFFFRSTWPDLS